MEQIRPFQKRLLIIGAILMILAGLTPHITVINQEYPALMCSEDTYDTGAEECEIVTLRLHGIYFSTPVGHDRYYGTLHILDYPRNGKNSGGKFEPLELAELFDSGTQHGGLWYYSEKRERYEDLGMIFWDAANEQIFIHGEHYFAYPAASVAEMQQLWDELTAY